MFDFGTKKPVLETGFYGGCHYMKVEDVCKMMAVGIVLLIVPLSIFIVPSSSSSLFGNSPIPESFVDKEQQQYPNERKKYHTTLLCYLLFSIRKIQSKKDI